MCKELLTYLPDFEVQTARINGEANNFLFNDIHEGSGGY